jgi:hypothetical protein
MALDFGIAQMNMPPMADMKNSPPHNQSMDSARKATIWTQISACAALSLLAKDANIFIFGAGFAVALDWFYRHANAVHPGTGMVTMPPEGGPQPGGVQ